MLTRWSFRILTVLLFASAPVSNFASADFDKGQEAFDAGDYETAMQEWMIDADQGNLDAQYNLANQYARGEGAPQNLPEAVKWLGIAAEQGHEQAKTDLGRMLVCTRLGVLEYGYAHIIVGNGARGDMNFETFNDITYVCSGLVLSNTSD